MSNLRNPLATVLGLGSSKNGAEHWWVQRLTAVALVPLSLWFIISVISILGATEAEARDWLSSPLTAVPMLLFLFVGFHHLRQGLGEIAEDYIHNRGILVVVLMIITFGCAVLGLASIYSVLKIAFGG